MFNWPETKLNQTFQQWQSSNATIVRFGIWCPSDQDRFKVPKNIEVTTFAPVCLMASRSLSSGGFRTFMVLKPGIDPFGPDRNARGRFMILTVIISISDNKNHFDINTCG